MKPISSQHSSSEASKKERKSEEEDCNLPAELQSKLQWSADAAVLFIWVCSAVTDTKGQLQRQSDCQKPSETKGKECFSQSYSLSLSLSPDHSQLSFLIALSHIANTVTAFNKVFSLQNKTKLENLYFVTWWFQALWRIIIIECKKQRNWLRQYIKCVKCIRRVFVFQWCPSRVRYIVLFFCTSQWRDSICFFWA